jgi:hypothetical protein
MKEKLNELYAVKRSVESQEFQKHVMKPLLKELDKLKDAYDCKTLAELSELRGRNWGLKRTIDIFKQIETDIKSLKFEIESTDETKL